MKDMVWRHIYRECAVWHVNAGTKCSWVFYIMLVNVAGHRSWWGEEQLQRSGSWRLVDLSHWWVNTPPITQGLSFNCPPTCTSRRAVCRVCTPRCHACCIMIIHVYSSPAQVCIICVNVAINCEIIMGQWVLAHTSTRVMGQIIGVSMTIHCSLLGVYSTC